MKENIPEYIVNCIELYALLDIGIYSIYLTPFYLLLNFTFHLSLKFVHNVGSICKVKALALKLANIICAFLKGHPLDRVFSRVL